MRQAYDYWQDQPDNYEVPIYPPPARGDGVVFPRSETNRSGALPRLFPSADRSPLDGAGLCRTVGLVTALPRTDSHLPNSFTSVPHTGSSGASQPGGHYFAFINVAARAPLQGLHKRNTTLTLIVEAFQIYLETYRSVQIHKLSSSPKSHRTFVFSKKMCQCIQVCVLTHN